MEMTEVKTCSVCKDERINDRLKPRPLIPVGPILVCEKCDGDLAELIRNRRDEATGT